MLNKIHLHYTVASLLAIVGAVIAVAVSFGLHLTQENTRSIMLLAGLILGGITIGGGLKSAAMLNAGVHPIQKAAAKIQQEQTTAMLGKLGSPIVGRAVEASDPETGRVTVTLEPTEKVDLDDFFRRDPGGPVRRYTGHASDIHPLLRAYGTFGDLRLGKQAARIDPRTPQLAEFMTHAATLGRRLPKATHRFDELLAEIGADLGMMGNASYGDCTCAAIGHGDQFWTGVGGGKPFTATEAQILAIYWATGSQDDGRVMFDVLKYVHHNGLAGRQIIDSYVAVGLRRYQHRDVRAAIDMFGGCYLGVGLPETAQSQSVWDVVGDPTKPGPAQFASWGGHAIWAGDYDHDGVDVVTWGHKQRMTWRFLDAYADEGYAIISPDWMRGGKTVEGIDLAGLNAYLAKIKAGYQPPM